MADDLSNLFFDLTGAAESPFKEPPPETPAPAPVTEPDKPGSTTEPTATSTPIDDTEYESPEQVQDKLREEWGPDFEQKFEDASKAVQQFFKNDDETLEWLSQRIGNHPVAVKIALRLAAIYSGHGLPDKTAAASTAANKSLDAQIAEYHPAAPSIPTGWRQAWRKRKKAGPVQKEIRQPGAHRPKRLRNSMTGTVTPLNNPGKENHVGLF